MDFTTLFTETLNKTIAELVTAAVTAETAALRAEVEDLRATVRELEESAVDSDGVERLVESTIDNYDFSEIVRDNVDTDSLFEQDGFASAVREVIADALR